MPKVGARLKIRSTSVIPMSAQVELEGVDISHATRGVEVKFDVGSVTEATLKLMVDELDVDAHTLSLLHAHVDAQQSEHDATGEPE